MFKKAFISLLLTLAVFGCSQGELDFKIKYDRIEGLQKGDKVIFDQNQIGTVEEVFHTKKGYYLVDVCIGPNFSNGVTEHSRFFIVNDPDKNSGKAIEMTKIEKGGAPLGDGVVVEGSTRSSAILEKLQNGVDKGLGELREQIDKLKEKVEGIQESEEYNNLRDKIEKLTEEIKKAGKSAREKMEKEVIPRLKEELEDLKKKFSQPEPQGEERPIET